MKEELEEGEYIVKEYYGSYFPISRGSLFLTPEGKRLIRVSCLSGTWYVTNKRLVFERGVEIEIFSLNELVNLELQDLYADSKVITATFQKTGYEPEKFGIYIPKPEELQEILTKAKEGKELPELKRQKRKHKMKIDSSVKGEEKVPKVVDMRGYVLTQEEIRAEVEIYKKAGVSFLCPHCRGIVGTNDYKEFVRRRAMIKPVPHYFTHDGRLILGKEPIEEETRIEKISKRKWILQLTSVVVATAIFLLNSVLVRNSDLKLLFMVLIFAGLIAVLVKLETD